MLADHQRFPGLVALTCCWQLHAKPRLQLFTQQTPAHVNLLNLSCPWYVLHVALLLVAYFPVVLVPPEGQTKRGFGLASF